MSVRESIYKELHQTINMSPAELRVWLRTDLAPITVANYSDAPSMEQSKKWLRIISKNSDELTNADCDFARIILQRIKYLKRIKIRAGHNKMDWENSLRNMGFDLKKEKKTFNPMYD